MHGEERCPETRLEVLVMLRMQLDQHRTLTNEMSESDRCLKRFYTTRGRGWEVGRKTAIAKEQQYLVCWTFQEYMKSESNK